MIGARVERLELPASEGWRSAHPSRAAMRAPSTSPPKARKPVRRGSSGRLAAVAGLATGRCIQAVSL